MVLVVGYGNPLRSDDSVGIRVAERIRDENIPDVEIRTFQQLPVELLEEFLKYDMVILADCASEGPEVSIRRIEPNVASNLPQGASTHHFKPEGYLSLSRSLYGKVFPLLVCTVRGESFEFGCALSPAVSLRVEKAVRLIRETILSDINYARS